MFASLRFALHEYVNNRKLLFKLAYIHMSQATVRSTWGVVWVYIHDILYFTAFTLFRILLTGNRGVEGMNSVEYLMTGLVPWLIISEVLNSATNAIRNNKVIIQSIRFPITILPGVEVLAILLKRLPTFLFIVIVCAYYGHIHLFQPLLFFYYLLCIVVLLFALTVLFSGLIAVSEDFHQVYMAVMRILFFTLPIMWDFKAFAGSSFESWANLLKLNPLIYIVEGFRDAFLLGQVPSTRYTIYFWVFTFLVLWLGCFVQRRLQKFYSDFI